MSTFLELCQETRAECGIEGSGPSSIASAFGIELFVLRWVKRAWINIQNESMHMDFMQGTFSFQTVAGTESYTPATAGVTDLGEWKKDSFFIYPTSDGKSTERQLQYLQYPNWRNHYSLGVVDAGPPAYWAQNPTDKAIILGPEPDGIYTVSGLYTRVPQTLTNDGDTPDMPAQFHDLIMYEAMKFYASFENAPEVYAMAEREASKLWTRLRHDQLPEISVGIGPIA